jgi:hypothetical protein
MTEQPRHRLSRVGLALTVALIILGLGMVLFFGLRAHRDYRRLHERGLSPGVTDVEAIRGWMTLPYIAHAYGVPQARLFDELGLPQAGNERLSIRQLAEKYHRDPAQVREEVQQAILDYRQASPPQREGTP